MSFISRIKRDRHRKIEEKYARANGFFWLPCPLCGEPFGGHEVDWEAVHTFIDSQDSPGYGALICPRCVEERQGETFPLPLDGSDVVQVHWWPKQDEEEGKA
jgi:hypothetical protein